MVEEEERLDGLGIVNPRSKYLGPSTPELPPSICLHLVLLFCLFFVSCMRWPCRART